MTITETRLDRLRREAGELPDRAGVYVFRDDGGEVLYVGKAKSLRSRVRSYFNADAGRGVRVRELVRRIQDLETFVLDTETEALLLEWNLIKEHEPRFNVQLRDDKSYPYVRVTVQEPFPRVMVTRRLERDGSRYFGPYTDVGGMRSALRMIKKLYPVRSCHYDMPEELPDRPCLDYHIGRCEAPCAGYQSQEEYREMIDQILGILSGQTARVKRTVRERMEAAARELDFERAAELRDVLDGLSAMERRRAPVDFRGGDRDVLGVARRGSTACGVVLRVRDGRLMGREVHYLSEPGATSDSLTGAFVKGFYLRQQELPPELLVPGEFEDRELVAEYLSVRREGAFRIQVPERGRKRRLVDLAEENAEHLLRREAGGGAREGAEELEPSGGPDAAARSLARALGLEGPPRSMLCFDVSTLQGADSVGSAVWLDRGGPRKDEYRRFRIRGTEEGRPDDYAMMQEIVGRYFERRVREGDELPDLVVVDGGRGQLGAARQAMEAAGVSDLPLAALAKREEEVFLPDRSEPLRLEATDPGRHWLQRARDEAHRFALAYNRNLRRRRTLRSRLSEIEGVGPSREQALLERFGSLEAVRHASEDELAETPGVGSETARRIRSALAGDEG